MFSELQIFSDEIQKSAIKRLCGCRVIDLIMHKPHRFVDRSKPLNINGQDKIVTVIAEVLCHIPSKYKGRPHKVQCKTNGTFLDLIFFNSSIRYLYGVLKPNSQIVVSGKLEGDNKIVHPDYIADVGKYDEIAILEPIYLLTKGISNKVMRNIIRAALTMVPDLPEWIDLPLIESYQWGSWRESIVNLHTPNTIEESASAIERLAYDELLNYSIGLTKIKSDINENEGRIIKGDGTLRRDVLAKLQFELTEGQQTVLEEIYAEQCKPMRMNRLLQGDVGCGKTLVALLAILNVLECNYQAAFLAPTEVLATQHYNWLSSLLVGVEVVLLVGKSRKKTQKYDDIKSGKTRIVVGTHTLFNESIQFSKLALIVIDEQHKFGVKHRAMLVEKDSRTDVLMMTATPIPRSLSMVLYGGMEVSYIYDKPKDRLPIETTVLSDAKLGELVERINNSSNKVYWICPLIEESEKLDLTAAEERFQFLQEKLGSENVCMVHGRMKSEERDKIIGKFRDSEKMVLVSTTVIEVGIDVPDACIMIIENAERFGLAQLHQLRGRVGRSNLQSFCVLVYKKLSGNAIFRLKIMRETNDGFFIAQEDLRLRGGGDIMGLRQSGWPVFIFFNPYIHKDFARLVRKQLDSNNGDFGRYNDLIQIFKNLENSIDNNSRV